MKEGRLWQQHQNSHIWSGSPLAEPHRTHPRCSDARRYTQMGDDSAMRSWISVRNICTLMICTLVVLLWFIELDTTAPDTSTIYSHYLVARFLMKHCQPSNSSCQPLVSCTVCEDWNLNQSEFGGPEERLGGYRSAVFGERRGCEDRAGLSATDRLHRPCFPSVAAIISDSSFIQSISQPTDRVQPLLESRHHAL